MTIKLNANALLKAGWIRAVRKDNQIDWLYVSDGQYLKFTFAEAKKITMDSNPGKYHG